MAPSPNVIVALPLEQLRDEPGELTLLRERYLTQEELTRLLQCGQVRFVVADIGKPLKWIPPSEIYRFWKSELRSRLVDNPEHFRLEDFPGGYCYLASEWTGANAVVVLLEVYH